MVGSDFPLISANLSMTYAIEHYIHIASMSSARLSFVHSHRNRSGISLQTEEKLPICIDLRSPNNGMVVHSRQAKSIVHKYENPNPGYVIYFSPIAPPQAQPGVGPFPLCHDQICLNPEGVGPYVRASLWCHNTSRSGSLPQGFLAGVARLFT